MAQDQLSGGVFQKLSVAEFHALLEGVTLHRTIDSIHLHHTWVPRHEQFQGAASIVAMWKFHTQTNGWADIAQHLTADPAGSMWTGRHWERPPASATGFNGSSKSGPFMIEMIGDFDTGQNPFQDPQKGAVLSVLALLLDKFALATSAIRFHNEMSSKTCPGSAIDKATLLREVEKQRAKKGRSVLPAIESPFSAELDSLWRARHFLAGPAQEGSTRDTGPLVIAPFRDEGELEEAETVGAAPRSIDAMASELAMAARAVRDVDVTLSAAVKESLRPYVVNLTNGKFSSTGEFTTTKADVDTIFDQHLPKALANVSNGPLRIVVYAHGGLVGEKDGLGVALKHVDWWVANGVYPLYFAWETGLLSTLINVIKAELGGSRSTAARDGFDIADALIEAAARRASANRVWRDMKHVAELASAADGGARYVADRLAAFCAAHGASVEVHAIGHSAGSNFHGFFVPAALTAGVPSFKTLQFLAPAMTVDGFFSSLAPKLGQVGPVTIFTMKDSFELDDVCAGLYHKSLLYLIYFCLEDTRELDLLGLERSIRNDLRLKRLFGLDGTPSVRGHEIIWSVTTGDRRSSSESVRHGGFDDDPATMNSVLRRVLNLSGADEVKKEFAVQSRAVDVEIWSNGVAGAPGLSLASEPEAEIADSTQVSAPARVSTGGSGGGGRRRALCVGINAYKRNALNGCVADAERWAATLSGLGFEVKPVMRDAAATGNAIVKALTNLIRESDAGDRVVFQFAGHGTTLPDDNGDEAGGDSPGDDEALCPYDFTEGRFIVDDELAGVMSAASAKGVRLTSFIDCCHSGTITRLGVGPAPGPASRQRDERPRFVVALPSEVSAHRAMRGFSRGASRTRVAGDHDVLFSACQSTEVAWESDGQGDFTRYATAALGKGSLSTNGNLLARVKSAFGKHPRQHPELHPPDAKDGALFGGDVDGSPTRVPPPNDGAGGSNSDEIASILRKLADAISR